MRSGSYKLARRSPKTAWELYDLCTDLGEQEDLASEKADVVASLADEFVRWQKTR